MFVLRSAAPSDHEQLQPLAAQLDTVNLPHDACALAEILHLSERSFLGQVPREHARFLFCLEDPSSGRILGCSMLMAEHGNTHDPHHFFQIDVDQRHSYTLQRQFEHRTLTFRQIFNAPHSELGALILDPPLRGHPQRLGRLLSLGRMLFIAARPDNFCPTVQAELLPPFESDGSSLLWEWLGRRFTGLSYADADRLSRTNHEFMTALFPQVPLHTSLMPVDVQAAIGSVGPATLGVARLLHSQGFRFNQHIDPFDGGPHLEARVSDIPIVRDARTRTVITDAPVHTQELGVPNVPALVGRLDNGRWRCICLPLPPIADDPQGISLPRDACHALLVGNGDEVLVSTLQRSPDP
jgi:arginine N-succinyltransferase